MPNPVSPLALSVSDLYNVLLIISAVVVIAIAVLVVYMMVRFRQRGGPGEPRQVFGSRRLEIAWTAGPLILLAIIFFFAVGVMQAETPQPQAKDADLQITVTGNQWWWKVQYPSANVTTANEIHIPVHKNVLVTLTSDDVIHDLWIPQLGPKEDAFPAQNNYMWLRSDVAGTFSGACAEYCGTEHAWMRITAIAQPEADFNSWLQHEAQPAAAPSAGNAVNGAKIFAQRTCISCHAIGGTAANADVGPDLTHFGSRPVIAAGVLENTPQNLETWLRNPQAVKPGVLMPNVRLTASEITDLTAYLESLK